MYHFEPSIEVSMELIAVPSAGNDGVRPRCGSAALRRVVRVGAQTGLEGLRRRAPHAAGIVPIAPCSIAAHPQKESAPVGLIPVF